MHVSIGSSRLSETSGMRPLRADEEQIRIVLERALGVPVKQHDDGSEPGMYDLDIVYPDRPFAALEITAAADSDSIELWRVMNDGERWCEENLEGGWSVTVDPTARGKLLREDLPELLRRLEGAGMREFRRGHRHPEELERAAARLKVVSAFQGETEFPGSIYPTIELPPERSGGFVGESGDPLADCSASSSRMTAGLVSAASSHARVRRRHTPSSSRWASVPRPSASPISSSGTTRHSPVSIHGCPVRSARFGLRARGQPGGSSAGPSASAGRLRQVVIRRGSSASRRRQWRR